MGKQLASTLDKNHVKYKYTDNSRACLETTKIVSGLMTIISMMELIFSQHYRKSSKYLEKSKILNEYSISPL